jgi:hypothetical protein
MFSNGSVVIDTMPVDSQQSCMSIVQMVNSQPSQGGRRVKAACYISTKKKMIQYQMTMTNIKTHFSQVRRMKTPLIDFLMEPSNVDLLEFWFLYGAVGTVSFMRWHCLCIRLRVTTNKEKNT